ncbi:MAG: alpha/beta hydrolase [Actinomycetota bacterium]|nr:alpha/beta hydrolase [Actinomycetota bacterium]
MSQLAPHPGVRRVIDLPSGPVAIHDTAAGPDVAPAGDVLLVPGFTGSKEDFAPILGGLSAAGFRTVAMDLPGQHESPGPADQSAYAVDVLARAVLAVAVAMADTRVHLLGHSFGGLVGRAAAIAAPHRLRSLVLLGSGPSAIGGVRAERLRILRPVLDTGGMPAVYAAMEEYDRMNLRYGEVTPPELADFLRRRFLASSAHGLRGMGDALESEPDRVAELRATGLPVLVAYGDHDDAWEPPVQADMAARLGARHAVIAGALHSPAIEQTDRTVAVLTEFWSRVP